MSFVRHIIRFVVAALVIWFVAFLVPGFRVAGFWSALFAALAIALIGWAVEAFFGRTPTPFTRGFIGFLISAGVIYLSQFFVPGFRVTLIGAIIGALVIGLIDLVVPAGNVLPRKER